MEGIAGIGRRLRQEIDLLRPEGRRRGIGLFKDRMAAVSERLEISGERAVPGLSYPSIRTYLSGDVIPSLEFLRAAAEVFGVRLAWLVTGEGGRTKRAGSEGVSEPPRPSILDPILEEHPVLSDLDSFTLAMIVDTAFHIAEAAQALEISAPELEPQKALHGLARFIMDPLYTWSELAGYYEVHVPSLSSYVMAILSAYRVGLDHVIAPAVHIAAQGLAPQIEEGREDDEEE